MVSELVTISSNNQLLTQEAYLTGGENKKKTFKPLIPISIFF
jgi:hypothetical protein